MGFFWNKKIEGNKIIIFRNKKQKDRSMKLILFGLGLFFGVSILVLLIAAVFPSFKNFFNIYLGKLMFYIWIIGALIVIFTAIGMSYSIFPFWWKILTGNYEATTSKDFDKYVFKK